LDTALSRLQRLFSLFTVLALFNWSLPPRGLHRLHDSRHDERNNSTDPHECMHRRKPIMLAVATMAPIIYVSLRSRSNESSYYVSSDGRSRSSRMYETSTSARDWSAGT